MSNISTTVNILKDLGFTEYQAKCLIAIIKQDITTPKKISDLTGIPRSNVYEAAEQLSKKGLIEIKQDGKQKYKPTKTKEIIKDLETQQNKKLSKLKKSLSKIETQKTEEIDGIWTTNGKEKVIDRTKELLEKAKNEIVIIASEKTTPQNYIKILKKANKSNIKIIVATNSEKIKNEISQKIPKIKIIDKSKEWILNQEIIKIIMVDKNKILTAHTHEAHGRPNEITGNLCLENNIITKILTNLLNNYIETKNNT